MSGADRRARWVVLDVGETIIDETRIWRAWADELGIPQMTFMSVFGAIVARGQGYQDLAGYFSIDDWRRHREAVDERIGGFRRDDLYADAIPAIDGLRERGYRVAVIGNQPAERHAELQALGVHPEVMAMSEDMGVMKPDPDFFRVALHLLGDADPDDVAYVGDRIDNDVVPSSAAGMRSIWLRRGPWGVVPTKEPAEADLIVDSLAELVSRIDEAWA
jgi:HAD superfamily hydrolase (TIGR01549 family)